LVVAVASRANQQDGRASEKKNGEERRGERERERERERELQEDGFGKSSLLNLGAGIRAAETAEGKPQNHSKSIKRLEQEHV